MNKRNYISILLITIVLATMFSCQKIIDGSFPEFERKLVVNAKFLNDSALIVYVYHNKNVLDTQAIQFEKNAKVILYENEQIIDTLALVSIFNPFIYFIPYSYRTENFKPQPEHEYKLKVSDSQNMKAECKVKMPAVTTLLSVDTATVYKTGSDPLYIDMTRYFQVKLKFADPPQTADYYMISLFLHRKQEFMYDTVLSVYETSEYIYFDCDDPIFQNEYESRTHKVFSDNLFNGLDKQFTLEMYMPYINTTVNSELYVQLTHISEDTYKYAISKQKYYDNEGNPLSEPVQIFSNISGGIGIALSETRTSQMIVLSRSTKK